MAPVSILHPQTGYPNILAIYFISSGNMMEQCLKYATTTSFPFSSQSTMPLILQFLSMHTTNSGIQANNTAGTKHAAVYNL